MGVLLQTRAKMKVGRAVGSDGVSAMMLKTLPWETLRLVLQALQSLSQRQIVTRSVAKDSGHRDFEK